MRSFTSLVSALVLSTSLFAAAGCATSGSEDSYGETQGEAASAGKVGVWQATDGQWHFHLKSGNGAILLTSEAYTSRTSALNGVLSTLDNGVDTAQYKVVAATHGFVIHLVAGNNQVLSFSEVYSTRSNATRAVASCVRAVTSYLDKREANTTGARVEIHAGASTFSFAYYASNGQQVLASESYQSAAAAYNGAFAVQAVGGSASAYHQLVARDGSFYFTVTAANNQVIGVSQMYSSKQASESGAASVQAIVAAVSVL